MRQADIGSKTLSVWACPITILMTIIFSIYTPYMFPLIPEWGNR